VVKQVFDFTSNLAIGETISTATCTCTVFSGIDGSPSSVINGAASISGTQVTQSLTGGVVGVIYNIQCSVTTSTSQTLQMQGLLAIIPVAT
jgi:hypothetical protein